MKNLQLKDLEYLIALHKYCNFHKAAVECKVSQPTVSGQIKKLESILNLKIVERNSRKVLFTESGLAIVNQAKKIIEEIKNLRELSLHLKKEMSGIIRVGIIPTLAPYIISDIIREFSNKYPNLELYFIEDYTVNLIESLEKGNLDILILSHVKEADSFIQYELINEEVFLLVNKDSSIGKNKIISLKEILNNDIKNNKLLLLNNLNCFYSHTKEICSSFGLETDNHLHGTSIETIKSMVSNNIGMTIAPKLSLIDNTDLNIKPIKIEENIFRRIEFIFRPGSALKERYDNCYKLIREVLVRLNKVEI